MNAERKKANSLTSTTTKMKNQAKNSQKRRFPTKLHRDLLMENVNVIVQSIKREPSALFVNENVTIGTTIQIWR